jgi:tetratricopeptide (TPR) repeat protein
MKVNDGRFARCPVMEGRSVLPTLVFWKFCVISGFLPVPVSATEQGLKLNPPPTEVTSEIVAARGCLEGVDHPSGAALSAPQQTAACDRHVELENNSVSARYFRALHLFETATTSEGRKTAYDDFSVVIASGQQTASAFANRAWLNIRFRDNVQEALSDIDRAIALEPDRGTYFERRAYIKLAFAKRASDEKMAEAALEDIQTALSLKPSSKVASQLDAWARNFLAKLRARTDPPAHQD